jgi:hypothetical protein
MKRKINKKTFLIIAILLIIVWVRRVQIRGPHPGLPARLGLEGFVGWN